MEKVWLTSDLHFGHANIIKYCRSVFTDVASMDAYLISQWNSLVDSEDVVYVLGDFAKDSAYGLSLVNKLRGRKILVVGNHDTCHPRWPGAAEARLQFLDAGWSEIHEFLRRKVDGIDLLIHHYPFAGNPVYGDAESGDSRYAPVDGGEILLHGHVHDLWKVKGRMLNVGVDVWDYKPVAWDVALATLRKST